jgi:SAM-dependent methyltransferase
MHGPPPTSAADHWDDFYDRDPQVWSGRPNALLVAEVADLTPGTALDVGCGEGADAVWLAERGWQVTAIDVSRTALDRGARRAAAAGVADRIVWQHHDLASSFPTGTYDLVTALYLHSPIALERDPILRAAAAAVAAGGTLLVVGHAAAPPWAAHEHHPPEHRAFPQPDDTAAGIGLHDGAWVLETCAVRQRSTTDPAGQPATVSDSVVRARRR